MSIEITVGSNFEAALKSFESKVKRSGLLQELKRRGSYEPPSARRRRERADNIRRSRRTEEATVKFKAYRAVERRTAEQQFQRERRFKLAEEKETV